MIKSALYVRVSMMCILSIGTRPLKAGFFSLNRYRKESVEKQNERLRDETD